MTPSVAKDATGVLSVDGHELSRKTIKHTIPLVMSIDETFDVGANTRTPVDESYDVPFRFTGTIDKLTFNLGPSGSPMNRFLAVSAAVEAAHICERAATMPYPMAGIPQLRHSSSRSAMSA
jgi:hypothetical protein